MSSAAAASQTVRSRLRRLSWALAGLLLALHAALFAAVLKSNLVTDLELHATVVRVGIDVHRLPGNFLFYLTTAVLAGFQDSNGAVKAAMVVVLAVSVAAKYLLSANIAAREVGSGLVSAGLLVAVALLSFAFSLPTQTIYLGQFPPNVWHNSTTIFLMPFAVALFWASAQFLRTSDRKWLWRIAGLAALNVAAKASLVFPMLLVFPLFALVRFRSGRALWQAVAVTAFMGLLVLLQYLYVFETGSEQTIYKAAGFVGEANSHVRIDLFHVWSHYSHDVPLSIAASCVFPLVALVAYGRRLIDYDLVRYALALMAVSIAIFAIFTETGVREFHGNFIWQAMVANYLLFLTVLIRVWTLWSYRREPVRSIAVAGAFAAHVLAGFAFLVYYFANGTYF